MEHYYTKLLHDWEAEMDTLEARVFSILRQIYPAGRSRRELVWEVYGVEANENINNDLHDRAIRRAIQQMRLRDIPIFASSGASGYRLCLSDSELGQMVIDLRGRRESLDDQIRSLETTVARLRHAREAALPEQYPAREKAEQLSFIK